MPIWTVLPIVQEPETRLRSWRVIELLDGSRHLVGYATDAREGRTSSAIREFDVGLLRAVTASGRVYELVGPPSVDPDADYVWARWRRINDIDEFADVTAQVWGQHTADSKASDLDSEVQP